MKYEERFIVQDLETHEFIYPDPFGYVGFTQNLKSAGHFESYEDALNSGVNEIGGGFQIFKFFVKSE
ncbi:TPA: hypothetical protein ACLBE3_002101 [Neisseria meningitidis]|uniref:Phage associated protein n=1 Tax=Neisseria lactamica TaxID=486 RepID=A0AAU8VIV9_NEILA|nr:MULTISPECIES: hypothetical protein [Bacteria]ARB05376.1 hypothetical protein B2G52_11335 [Neisseria lactamica]CBX23091.1 unnamed protein product [Neisseria lactamica Y92-1009]